MTIVVCGFAWNFVRETKAALALRNRKKQPWEIEPDNL
jgi:hypothetical protein